MAKIGQNLKAVSMMIHCEALKARVPYQNMQV